LLSVVGKKRERLSVLEQNALDGQVALLRGDLLAYVSAARRNDEVFGPNLDQARGLLWLKRPREAIDVLTRIDTTDVLSGARPEYWRLLHDAHHMLGEYERAIDAGERARAKFPDNAGALRTSVPTLAALGRTEALHQRLDELAGLPGRGELSLTDDVLEAIYELRAHGHHGASRTMLGSLTERLMTRGEESAQGQGVRARLAAAFYLAERWDEARQQIEALIGERTSGIDGLGLLGVISARQGDRAAALAISAQLRDLDGRYLFGANNMARARVAAALGERQQAVALIRAALAAGYRYSLALHRDVYFEALRDYAPFQELTFARG
jgi:tetratricopeptide (TPR) repeat protein